MFRCGWFGCHSLFLLSLLSSYSPHHFPFSLSPPSVRPSLQVIKDSMRNKSDLSDMSRMWVSERSLRPCPQASPQLGVFWPACCPDAQPPEPCQTERCRVTSGLTMALAGSPLYEPSGFKPAVFPPRSQLIWKRVCLDTS